MEVTEKGIAINGFEVGGIKEGKYGLAIISSRLPCSCGIMVTSNKVRAAPLLVSKEHSKNKIRAIIANSGNANAYTGKEGYLDALKMCDFGAEYLGIKAEEVVVASTGVIGRRMDMDKIKKQMKKVSKKLKNNSEASEKVAKSITTTDTFSKSISVSVRLKTGDTVEIGGVAKGAGMIAPQLSHATMMCFLTSDAYIPEDKITSILERSVRQSFDMTVVDGDMSTNDIVVLLSNGKANNTDIDENFQLALDFVTRELAKMIAKDGEGATKFLEAEVKGCKSKEDAKKAARTIVGSNLVKTAIFGKDPNWGRIIAALGYSGAEFNPEEVTLKLKSDKKEAILVKNGRPLAFEGTVELEIAESILEEKDIFVEVELDKGGFGATAFGCDLTCEYVKINAEYTT